MLLIPPNIAIGWVKPEMLSEIALFHTTYHISHTLSLNIFEKSHTRKVVPPKKSRIQNLPPQKQKTRVLETPFPGIGPPLIWRSGCLVEFGVALFPAINTGEVWF